MKVKVKLFATLINGRFKENYFEIDNDYLLDKFNLTHDEVTIIFINGRHANYDTLIENGDDIAFFPPIGGG